MNQKVITLELTPGILIGKINGMKPIVMQKKENHHYTETGETTISGIDMITGGIVELPTRYLRPIRQENN